MNDCIGLEPHVGVDPRRRRITSSRGEHVLLVDAVAQRGRCRSELRSGVDFLCIEARVGDLRRHAHLRGKVAHGVGQIELALPVLVIELVECRPDVIGGEH